MEWMNQLEVLSKIAAVEPQATYCAFVGGFKHKIEYTIRTVPHIRKHLEKLDQAVDTKFIPTLIDGNFCNEMERKLLSLPAKYGGMGIVIFCDIAEDEYNNSRAVTASLIKLQLQQNTVYSVNREEIKMLKTNIKLEKLRQNTKKLNVMRCPLSDEKLKLNDIHQEKGASIWLSTLPLRDEGYCLNKQEFWDLVKLRYGWPLSRLPTQCICGAQYNVQHAFSCKKGCVIIWRHNHIRNLTTELLSQVTKDVKIEPVLQSLTGETFDQRTTNTSDDARLDFSTRRFWTKYQMAFFDVRVFDPNAKRYSTQILQRCYINNEKENKRQYNMRVLKVENGSFTPLVFSINEGMGREASKC